MSLTSDFDALNELVADPLLEELNDLLSEFNLFEALGVVGQELRHSNFLAWLFNPFENHGLGDYVVRKFVMLIAREINNPDFSITPAHVSSWQLEDAEIRREWHNIDILIADPDKKYVVVIENKIYSHEHTEQLDRYKISIEQEFHGAAQLFVFLTPDGTLPEDENSVYIPVTYEHIHNLISDVLKAKHNTLSSDIQIFIQHYLTTLERHILTDSEIARLCREIYTRNKHALDLILEHRPDIQAQIFDELRAMVQLDNRFTSVGSSKRYVRFEVRDWRASHLLKSEWNQTESVLWFEFGNEASRLSLKLIIGPGEASIRQYIHTIALAKTSLPLKLGYKVLGTKYHTIYSKEILRQPDYEGNDIDELRAKIHRGWQEFLNQDFPRINDVIMREVIHGYTGE